jgi:hypothetical protein
VYSINDTALSTSVSKTFLSSSNHIVVRHFSFCETTISKSSSNHDAGMPCSQFTGCWQA